MTRLLQRVHLRQDRIFAEHKPPALTLTRLLEEDLPLSWSEQRRKLGLFAQ